MDPDRGTGGPSRKVVEMRFPLSLQALSMAAILAIGATATMAQQQPFGQSPPGAAPKAAAKGGKAATPAAPDQTAAARPVAENPLRARVEQLEEQLVDLQVTIGTLESLARTTGTAASSSTYRGPSPASSGGGDSGAVASRVDGLEIQLRALVGQVEQLSDQIRALNGRRTAAPDPSEARTASAVPPAPRPLPPIGSAPPEPRATPGFGSTTVRPGGNSSGNDGIGQILSEEPSRAQPAAIPQGEAGNPKQLYETAYGYLLQQNYGAAETAFEDFLVRHPSDSLAGNAQYWLGESHFVRGQYKQAAGAFLKGYQAYARSAKAPDSLLKLAMSLDRLGQRDAACTSYGELNTRFPNAPQNVKARADSERRRIGCP
jgi:tol-pal system protein YbgF